MAEKKYENYEDCFPEVNWKPRHIEGHGCPFLPNMTKEACLTAVDSRDEFKGQRCEWCEKDCEGKHKCEVEERAKPVLNYSWGILGFETTTGGWLPYVAGWKRSLKN